MRVTNSMLVTNFMSDLNVNMTKLSKIQHQMATGKKYAHISDDPVALIFSQQARFKLHKLADYQKNLESSQAYLTQAETGVMEVNNIYKSVYERTIDAATDIKNGADLTNIAQYIGQMRDQVLQALNSAYGDKYVFGGYNTTGYTDQGAPVPPFTYEEVPVYSLVQAKDADGKPMFEPGTTTYVLEKADGGELMFDKDGNAIQAVAKAGDEIFDAGGNKITATGGEPVFDENGNAVQATADPGQMIYIGVYEEGDPIYAQVTAAGGELVFDADGKPVQAVAVGGETGYFDKDGNAIAVANPGDLLYDEKGEPVQATAAAGDTIYDVTVVGSERKLCYNGYRLDSESEVAKKALAVLQEDRLTFDVGVGVSLPVTVNGLDLAKFTVRELDADGNEVTKETNLYEVLDQLYNTLIDFGTQAVVEDENGVKKFKYPSGSAEKIGAFISDLQAGQNHVLAITADLGGRQNRVEVLTDRYESDNLNYTQMLSDAEDADFAEVVMNYKMAEAVYKAALSTGAYIIQPTLMDFLR